MTEDGITADRHTHAGGPAPPPPPFTFPDFCNDLGPCKVDLEPDVIEEPLAGPRMRKLGSILTNQLSPAFAALEARWLMEGRLCVVCEIAPRDDGRLLCGCCQVELRPAKLTPAEKEARRLQAYAIARQRAKAGQRDAHAAAA